MKKKIMNIFKDDSDDYASNVGYVYKLTAWSLSFLSFIVVVLLCIFLKCNLLSGIVTFLLVSSASFASGAAIGFLFGLPRAEKYRFINKSDLDHNAKEYGYGDNTNLEEVSDWLTKIIVGLTLIKLNTIIGWLNTSAHSIENVFTENCQDNIHLNAYVFGYSTIVLYFLAGAGLSYIWARTNLSLIFTKSKIAQHAVEKQTLMLSIQKLANTQLKPHEGISTTVANLDVPEERRALYPSENFKSITESIYNAKDIYDKTDIQKDRWGGKAKNGDYILEANYVPNPSKEESSTYQVKLSLRSLNPADAGIKEVAFFLHDSFPSQIVYTVMANNKAEINFAAYEAFVAGALTEDKRELELDLNEVSGFPNDFYWKKKYT